MTIPITTSSSPRKVFDLEERTFSFADRVRLYMQKLEATLLYRDDRDQLVRAAGSVAANYIEANEALGAGDFRMRIRICLKESKECRLWLRLIPCTDALKTEREFLIDESHQFVRIFSVILKNSFLKQKQKQA